MQLLSRIEPAAEPAVALTLVQAVLKGDKMDDVVRDAVMLGVAAIQPIVTKRTEVTVAALIKGARVDRWRRVALASVKQSRRAVVPDIRMPLTLETYLDEPPAALRLMLVEPGASRRWRRTALGAAGGRRRPPMPPCWWGPKAAGPSRNGPRPRARAACGSSRSATARCAPTPCRSPPSACCSFSGAISVEARERVDSRRPPCAIQRERSTTLKSCVLTSPSPSVIRTAPGRCWSRNAGSNHSPCSAGSTVAM